MSDEMSESSMPAGSIRMLQVPEASDWQCDIGGMTFIPVKGKEPNWFWRMTQHLALGMKWTRRHPSPVTPL